MYRIAPLPFRLALAGRGSLDLEGALSVARHLEGLLHVGSSTLRLEGVGAEHVQLAGRDGIRDDVARAPVDHLIGDRP